MVLHRPIEITALIVHPDSSLRLPDQSGVEGGSKTAHSSSDHNAPREFHSTIIRSAHSTSETKIAGLPNFAPQGFRSVSGTPLARKQAPQAKIGMCLATTLSSGSLKGGQPTGRIALT